MRAFFLAMLPATLILIAAPFLIPLLPDETPRRTPSVDASAIDHPKLSRSAREILSLSDQHQHPSRRTPVDRPGMRFDFVLPEWMAHEIREGRKHKLRDNPWMFRWADLELAIDGGPEFWVLARVRGSASAKVNRKCLNLKLLSSQRFTEEIRLRRLFLINLYADKLGFENRLCYGLMNELELFPPYQQLCVVRFNGESQGLYLAVERPEDAIRRVYPDTVSVDRRRSDHFELKWKKHDFDNVVQLDLLAAAAEIEDDEEQLARYLEVFDLDQYLRWQAFNCLIENGDTMDELFYYQRRDENGDVGRIQLMSWDFDDIQNEPSHPKDVHEDPLLYAAEGRIDLALIENPLMYARYRSVMRALYLDRFTEEHLHRAIEAVREELDGIDTRVAKRAKEMAQLEERLLERRRELLTLLEDD